MSELVKWGKQWAAVAGRVIMSTAASNEVVLDALDAIKAEMAPRLDALAEHFEDMQDPRAAAFFTGISASLAAVEEEADLLEVFFALSTTAFQGFSFDPVAAAGVDEVLAYAEQVSHAFTADSDSAH